MLAKQQLLSSMNKHRPTVRHLILRPWFLFSFAFFFQTFFVNLDFLQHLRAEELCIGTTVFELSSFRYVTVTTASELTNLTYQIDEININDNQGMHELKR